VHIYWPENTKKERFFEIFDIQPATNPERAMKRKIAERLSTGQFFFRDSLHEKT